MQMDALNSVDDVRALLASGRYVSDDSLPKSFRIRLAAV
jgi:hypothetical protein